MHAALASKTEHARHAEHLPNQGDDGAGCRRRNRKEQSRVVDRVNQKQRAHPLEHFDVQVDSATEHEHLKAAEQRIQYVGRIWRAAQIDDVLAEDENECRDEDAYRVHDPHRHR